MASFHAVRAPEANGLRIFSWARRLVAVFAALLLVSLVVGLLRPNRAEIAPAYGIESWPAVADGEHNSNTDLIHWRGAFWLIHAAAPWHFASRSTRLRLLRSDDARAWTVVTEFRNAGEDIRDPKFAVIGDRLFLYWLNNRQFPEPEPYLTQVTWSEDGRSWSPASGVGHDGWLFWRPKSPDGGRTWYCPAYWHKHGRAALFRSRDGLAWEKLGIVFDGEAVDETDLEFLPDGRMILTSRAEGRRSWLMARGWFGDNQGNTWIAVAPPPYESWTYARSYVTRLDGPRLFVYGGGVFAVGRYEPPAYKGFLFGTGSILNRKRTALFEVRPDGLTHLSDFPSAGDTSYAGVAIVGEQLFTSYYTSEVSRDWPWIVGMLRRSDIRMARLDVRKLASRLR